MLLGGPGCRHCPRRLTRNTPQPLGENTRTQGGTNMPAPMPRCPPPATPPSPQLSRHRRLQRRRRRWQGQCGLPWRPRHRCPPPHLRITGSRSAIEVDASAQRTCASGQSSDHVPYMDARSLSEVAAAPVATTCNGQCTATLTSRNEGGKPGARIVGPYLLWLVTSTALGLGRAVVPFTLYSKQQCCGDAA